MSSWCTSDVIAMSVWCHCIFILCSLLWHHIFTRIAFGHLFMRGTVAQLLFKKFSTSVFGRNLVHKIREIWIFTFTNEHAIYFLKRMVCFCRASLGNTVCSPFKAPNKILWYKTVRWLRAHRRRTCCVDRWAYLTKRAERTEQVARVGRAYFSARDGHAQHNAH